MLLTHLWTRATPENPNFALQSPEAWDTFLGGQKSSSGVRINRDTAYAHSAWWRGINLISRDVGKLPLLVFARNGEGKRRAIEHPAFPLLRRKPNDWQTALIFRQQLTAHALTSGNGYAYVVRQGDGAPVELLPLDPDTTFAVRANGQVWYVTRANGENRKLAKEDVLHIKGLGFDGLTGYSVFEKARESLGQGLAVQKFNTIFFKNAAKPAVILTHAAKLNEKTKSELRESWERMQTGLENAHRTAILDQGLQAKELAVSARNAQMIEILNYNTRDIANWIGVPVHKLGDASNASYNSLEQENQSYLDDSLSFWLHNWCAECWDKLLSEQEKRDDSYHIAFDLNELMSADLAAKSAYLRTALGGHPWLMLNEARGWLNLDPVEGGDVIPLPLNMSTGAEEGNPMPPAPKDEENPGTDTDDEPDDPDLPDNEDNRALAAAHAQIMREAAGRMVRRLTTHAKRAAKEPKTFLKWLDRFEIDHAETVRAAFSAPLAAISAAKKREIRAETAAKTLFERVKSELLRAAGEASAADFPAKIEVFSAEIEARVPEMLLSELAA